MLGFALRLPIDDELRAWADDGFMRLGEMLGRERLRGATVVLPEDKFFPDVYEQTLEGARRMAKRTAEYVGVAPDSFDLLVYSNSAVIAMKESMPFLSGETDGAAGVYFHGADAEKYVVGVERQQLRDPLSLVATIAHELVHVLLLGGGLLKREEPDMEPLTDLCTVFLGLGVFTAGSAFQFRQWTDTQTQGWKIGRKGYLPEPLWGYALARFAFERDEHDPSWAKHLPGNIRAYFKPSLRWLEKRSDKLWP